MQRLWSLSLQDWCAGGVVQLGWKVIYGTWLDFREGLRCDSCPLGQAGAWAVILHDGPSAALGLLLLPCHQQQVLKPPTGVDSAGVWKRLSFVTPAWVPQVSPSGNAVNESLLLVGRAAPSLRAVFFC